MLIEKKELAQEYKDEVSEIIEESEDVDELYSHWEDFSNKIIPKLVSVLLAETEALYEAGEYYKALGSVKKSIQG